MCFKQPKAPIETPDYKPEDAHKNFDSKVGPEEKVRDVPYNTDKTTGQNIRM